MRIARGSDEAVHILAVAGTLAPVDADIQLLHCRSIPQVHRMADVVCLRGVLLYILHHIGGNPAHHIQGFPVKPDAVQHIRLDGFRSVRWQSRIGRIVRLSAAGCEACRCHQQTQAETEKSSGAISSIFHIRSSLKEPFYNPSVQIKSTEKNFTLSAPFVEISSRRSSRTVICRGIFSSAWKLSRTRKTSLPSA